MLRNHSGASPLVHRIVFRSEVNVFATPAVADSKIIVKVDGKIAFSGEASGETSRIVSGLYVEPNQDVEVEIDGGGEVFLSILEENVKMIGGVSIAEVSYTTDGTLNEFDLPEPNKPAHIKDEVSVFLDGIAINAFDLNADKDKIVFNPAPYNGGILRIILTKPQD